MLEERHTNHSEGDSLGGGLEEKLYSKKHTRFFTILLVHSHRLAGAGCLAELAGWVCLAGSAWLAGWLTGWLPGWLAARLGLAGWLAG